MFRAKALRQELLRQELVAGPSLEMSSFCLFISDSNITTQHSIFTLFGTTYTGTDSFGYNLTLPILPS